MFNLKNKIKKNYLDLMEFRKTLGDVLHGHLQYFQTLDTSYHRARPLERLSPLWRIIVGVKNSREINKAG